jgi:hypothetical protein
VDSKHTGPYRPAGDEISYAAHWKKVAARNRLFGLTVLSFIPVAAAITIVEHLAAAGADRDWTRYPFFAYCAFLMTVSIRSNLINCPRCSRRWPTRSWGNRRCSGCGLPYGALTDPDAKRPTTSARLPRTDRRHPR